MQVTVKFFASLRERVGCDERRISVDGAPSVAAVWSVATDGAIAPPNTLAAVNLDYVTWDHAVQAGDEVAFFPPVTGG